MINSKQFKKSKLIFTFLSSVISLPMSVHAGVLEDALVNKLTSVIETTAKSTSETQSKITSVNTSISDVNASTAKYKSSQASIKSQIASFTSASNRSIETSKVLKSDLEKLNTSISAAKKADENAKLKVEELNKAFELASKSAEGPQKALADANAELAPHLTKLSQLNQILSKAKSALVSVQRTLKNLDEGVFDSAVKKAQEAYDNRSKTITKSAERSLLFTLNNAKANLAAAQKITKESEMTASKNVDLAQADVDDLSKSITELKSKMSHDEIAKKASQDPGRVKGIALVTAMNKAKAALDLAVKTKSATEASVSNASKTYDLKLEALKKSETDYMSQVATIKSLQSKSDEITKILESNAEKLKALSEDLISLKNTLAELAKTMASLKAELTVAIIAKKKADALAGSTLNLRFTNSKFDFDTELRESVPPVSDFYNANQEPVYVSVTDRGYEDVECYFGPYESELIPVSSKLETSSGIGVWKIYLDTKETYSSRYSLYCSYYQSDVSDSAVSEAESVEASKELASKELAVTTKMSQFDSETALKSDDSRVGYKTMIRQVIMQSGVNKLHSGGRCDYSATGLSTDYFAAIARKAYGETKFGSVPFDSLGDQSSKQLSETVSPIAQISEMPYALQFLNGDGSVSDEVYKFNGVSATLEVSLATDGDFLVIRRSWKDLKFGCNVQLESGVSGYAIVVNNQGQALLINSGGAVVGKTPDIRKFLDLNFNMEFKDDGKTFEIGF